MAQKYSDAYVINPIDHSGKINNDEFLMNCGGLTADRSDDRKNFMYNKLIYLETLLQEKML